MQNTRSLQKIKKGRDLSYPTFNNESRKKINEEVLNLNYTLDQMDLTDKNRTVHQTGAEYIFFSCAH